MLGHFKIYQIMLPFFLYLKIIHCNEYSSIDRIGGGGEGGGKGLSACKLCWDFLYYYDPRLVNYVCPCDHIIMIKVFLCLFLIKVFMCFMTCGYVQSHQARPVLHYSVDSR